MPVPKTVGELEDAVWATVDKVVEYGKVREREMDTRKKRARHRRAEPTHRPSLCSDFGRASSPRVARCSV
jgi:hypothetical protein